MIEYEIFLKQFLPKLRSDSAKLLNEKYKLNQMEIASKLGITQAEISKYLNHINTDAISYKIKKKDVQEFVTNLINENELQAQKVVCRICPVNSKTVCSFKIE